MARLQACRRIVALVVCTTVCSSVSGQNATLPADKVGHFDPSKYRLPVPVNSTGAVTEGVVSNVTVTHNMAINSTMPTANHWDFQQNPKYILPLPKNTTDVSGTAAGARVESALSPSASPSVATVEGSPSAASIEDSPSVAPAKIEAVSGFVKTQGQNFVLNGKAAYFAGTNAW